MLTVKERERSDEARAGPFVIVALSVSLSWGVVDMHGGNGVNLVAAGKDDLHVGPTSVALTI